MDEFDLDGLNAPGFDLDALTDDDFTDDLFGGVGGVGPQIARIPPRQKILKPKCVKYDHALAMAQDIGVLEPDDRVHAIVDGRFLFGDLIEAMLVQHDIKCSDMWIMTLTLTGGNIESLANLFAGGYCESLHLLVSDYWLSNERCAGGLLGYVVDVLGKYPNFQISACRTHAKIVLLDTVSAGRQVISGSANLRSSATAEQITIDRDDSVYAFYHQWMSAIEAKFWLMNDGRTIHGSKAIPKSQQWEL